MNDERWSILYSAVQAQLHPCNSLSVRVKLLENTNYSEASKIFGHCSISLKRNLGGKSRHTLLSINLIKKILLLTQISSTVDTHEQASLRELLAPINDKIRNFHLAEEHWKKRWLYKTSQERFNENPYQAGKELLDSKPDAKHFKGIFAGCTFSRIIFLAGINAVIEYTLASSAHKFVSTGNVAFPLIRAFMDDLNLMSSSVSGAQNLVHRCVKALS